MGKVDPDVVRGFELELKKAVEALKRWEKNCAQVREDYRNTHSMTISEAIRDKEAAKKPGMELWDFPSVKRRPLTGSSKKKQLTAAGAKEMGLTGDIEARKKKCDETIDALRKTIERLNKSRTSGTVAVKNPVVALHEKPKFVSKLVAKVSRGEMLYILEKRANWLRVRTAGDVEGWVSRSDVGETLPVELTSGPGTAAPKLTPEQAKQNADLMGAPGDTVDQ